MNAPNPIHPLPLAVLICAALAGAPSAQEAIATDPSAPFPEAPEQAGFRDDFDSLDKDRWYVSDGWTNGEHQDCHWSAGAVQVKDGKLTLFRIPAPPAPASGKSLPPRCGEVQTKGFFRYGTFEARIRTPKASGMNASVFTYAGPVHDYPHSEIDIEILTRNPGELAYNTFVDGKPMNGKTVPVAPPIDEAFHDVAFRWGPDGITWYTDGEETYRTAPGATLPDFPQKLYMSLWSTTTLVDWMGPLRKDVGIESYEIDWVAYTPLDKACLFPESVTCKAP